MKKIIFHPFTIIIFTLISTTILISLNKTRSKTTSSVRNTELLEEDIASISREVSQTEQSLAKSNHPLTREKILRNELLMQKEAEYIIQLPDINLAKTNNLEKNQQSPWEEWKKLLF
jgi:hypothetical protein